MSHSSRESNLAQYREALAQANSEFFYLLGERRSLCLKVQEYKAPQGKYQHFDPKREVDLFAASLEQLKKLSLKELFAFSLIMEDQAMAMAPGSYPNWSTRIHLSQGQNDLYEMINPLMLNSTHPELFAKLNLAADFQYLKDF
jgi:chorismate mutase